MPEITFGEIADGWAEIAFAFGQSPPVRTRMSYLTDPVGDLADWTLALAHGETTGQVSFTDEVYNWFLTFEAQPDGLYRLRLEQWKPWSINPTRSGSVMEQDWNSDPLELWPLGFQVWEELSRVQHHPGVLLWINDGQGCLPEGRYNRARCAKIAELKKALMG